MKLSVLRHIRVEKREPLPVSESTVTYTAGRRDLDVKVVRRKDVGFLPAKEKGARSLGLIVRSRHTVKAVRFSGLTGVPVGRSFGWCAIIVMNHPENGARAISLV